MPESSSLIVAPQDDANRRRFNFRVTFGCGPSSVSYELLEFAVVRQGTKEIEIATVDRDLPFRLSITLPVPQEQKAQREPTGLEFNIRHHFAGRSIKAVKKFNDAMLALKKCGVMEFYDLRRETLFFKSELQLNASDLQSEAFSQTLSDLSEISSRTGQNLDMPETLSQEQLAFLPTLLKVVRTGSAELGISGVSTTLVKDSQHARRFLEALDQHSTFGLDLTSYALPLLGKDVNLGRAIVVLEDAIVENPEKVRKEYLQAQDGDGVVVRLVPKGNVTVKVPRFLSGQ